MVNCPRCGGEMQEGKPFTQVYVSGGNTYQGFGMMGIPGMNLTGSEATEDIQWREKTGRKIGLLIKNDEEKTMKIIGLRCKICGYIEFYAQ